MWERDLYEWLRWLEPMLGFLARQLTNANYEPETSQLIKRCLSGFELEEVDTMTGDFLFDRIREASASEIDSGDNFDFGWD
jgi:hypothetical protein